MNPTNPLESVYFINLLYKIAHYFKNYNNMNRLGKIDIETTKIKTVKDTLTKIEDTRIEDIDKIMLNISNVYKSVNSMTEDLKELYTTDAENVKLSINQIYEKINNFKSSSDFWGFSAKVTLNPAWVKYFPNN